MSYSTLFAFLKRKQLVTFSKELYQNVLASYYNDVYFSPKWQPLCF